MADEIGKFRMRLEYVALRAVAGLVRLAPIDAAASVSAAAWRRLAPRYAKKRHERALANLRIAFPEKKILYFAPPFAAAHRGHKETRT